MTVTVTADMVMSLDGYIAGTDHSVANPGGEGADQIGGWIHAQSSWRERSGLDGGGPTPTPRSCVSGSRRPARSSWDG